MSEEDNFIIKTKLMEDLYAVDTQIQELESFTKVIAPECALDDLTRFELMNEQNVYKEQLRLAHIKRNGLLYAQERLKNSGALLCSECEDEIALERLLIMPEATLCIECANNK
jgi:DnaK suppressor protein